MTRANLLLSPIGIPMLNAFRADPGTGSLHVPILERDRNAFRTELLTGNNVRDFLKTADLLISEAKLGTSYNRNYLIAFIKEGSFPPGAVIEQRLSRTLTRRIQLVPVSPRKNDFLMVTVEWKLNGRRKKVWMAQTVQASARRGVATVGYLFEFGEVMALKGLAEMLGRDPREPAAHFAVVRGLGMLIRFSGQYPNYVPRRPFDVLAELFLEGKDPLAPETPFDISGRSKPYPAVRTLLGHPNPGNSLMPLVPKLREVLWEGTKRLIGVVESPKNAEVL
jgi:hypothetical protein